jgi:hypothetical protein
MALFGLFRRRAIRDPAALATFIDGQSLLLSERIVQDYARSRAGGAADALLATPAFRAALEKARWEAYPRALAMAGELAEGLLRPHAGDKGMAVLLALRALVLASFDRHAAPPAIGEADWRSARGELERSLRALSRERPRTLDAIAEEHASYYLAIMPIDARLQADDFAGLRNQLKSSLAAIGERLAAEADLRRLAEMLAALAPEATANPH